MSNRKAILKRAVRREAAREGVDPDVMDALVQQESGYNENAGSSAGARGLMQFMPGTAPGFGVKLGDGHALDDIRGGVKYIKQGLEKYGSYEQALSVYNSGRPDAYKNPGFAGGQTYNYVRTIMGNAKKGGGTPTVGKARTRSSKPGRAAVPDQTISIPGVGTPGAGPTVQDKLPLVQQFLAKKTSALDFALSVKSLQGTPATQSVAPTQVTIPGIPGTSGDVAGGVANSQDPDRAVANIKAAAEKIEKAQVPYLWGGGHQARQVPRGSKVTPLDCSGAVSRVLGINPRVAAQFKAWGKPGAKGRVVVYAKDTHVLMKIDGHFWGTSKSNAGGGAGWIDSKDVSPSYLAGFTARSL